MSQRASRLEEMGRLLTAAVAVLLTGASPLRKKSKNRGATPEAWLKSPVSKIDRREFQAGGKFFGLHRRVARRLGVSANCVQLVSAGRVSSPRVLAALTREINKTESSLGNVAPLSPTERALFKQGAKYHGVYSRAAKAAGLSIDFVQRVGYGRYYSVTALSAIRSEMKRVDGGQL